MSPSSSNRKYRAALAGCGSVSRSHIDFYPGWDIAELAACADPFPPARERAAAAVPGCRAWKDYAELLANTRDLDLFVIATRPNLHHSIALAAAKAGVRAVLCEKPMAHDLAQAEEMMDVCQQHGTRLIIGHQRRYDPQYSTARRLIREGKIGEVVSVEAYWPCSRQAYLGGHRLAVEGGGVVIYLGIHVFDMIHHLLGNTKTVSARLTKKPAESDIEDGAVCTLLLESGQTVLVNLGEAVYDIGGVAPEVSWLRFFITGTKGSLTFGDYSLSAWYRAGGKREWSPVQAGAEYQGGTGFMRLHRAIYDSLEERAPTLCDASNAIHAQRTAMACYESALTGAPVDTHHVRGDSPLAELVRQMPGRAWTIGGAPEY